MRQYELIDHTADIGIRVFGGHLSDLFENAALSMLDLMVATKEIAPGDKGKIREKKMKVSGFDPPDLLVNWLREIHFLWTVRNLFPFSIEMESIGETELAANVRFLEYVPAPEMMRHEIKAVTYHHLSVGNKSGIWEATVIFDM